MQQRAAAGQAAAAAAHVAVIDSSINAALEKLNQHIADMQLVRVAGDA